MTTYKIHPSIGIARVGTADDYYLAPETPGGLPINPDGRPFGPHDFRDKEGKVRRQGARFRVYRHEDDGRVTEVFPGKDGVAAIEWTVHVANKKPIWYQFQTLLGSQGYGPDHPLRNPTVTDPAERVKRIIDPGPRTLAKPGDRAAFTAATAPPGYPATFPPSGLQPWPIDTLGDALVDGDGRLVVLGGHGHSGTTQTDPEIVDYANNDDWWDDTSDGPVRARIVFDGDRKAVDAEAAWVLTAPPKYAPQAINLVTLWDTMNDVAIRKMGTRPEVFANGMWQRSYRPSFDDEVRPIFDRIRLYPYLVAIPPKPHDVDLDRLRDPSPAARGLREYYLSLLRPPGHPDYYKSPDNGFPMMPFLAGDNCFLPGVTTSKYLTLTDTQYFFLQQWADGHFTNDPTPVVNEAAALDSAYLHNCVGGAFSPGIEMTWISRNPAIYVEPFRLKAAPVAEPPLSLGEDFVLGLQPGDGAKYMALPWQADFNECSQEPFDDLYVWWWPAQRPIFVYVEGADGRVKQVPWVGSDGDQNAADYVQFADDLEMVKRWEGLGFLYGYQRHGTQVLLEADRR